MRTCFENAISQTEYDIWDAYDAMQQGNRDSASIYLSRANEHMKIYELSMLTDFDNETKELYLIVTNFTRVSIDRS